MNTGWMHSSGNLRGDVSNVEEAYVSQINGLLMKHLPRDHSQGDHVPSGPQVLPIIHGGYPKWRVRWSGREERRERNLGSLEAVKREIGVGGRDRKDGAQSARREDAQGCFRSSLSDRLELSL
jgi:hypothetical protein